MFRPISPESNDSDLFYVEQSSNKPSTLNPNTPIFLNSSAISGNNTQEMTKLSSIASHGPQMITIDSDSNEPTMPYRFGRKLPIIPPSLNDLNLPPDPFNILATMAVADLIAERYDERFSPQTTGAVGTVTGIDAPDEPQHNWGMGETTYDNGWSYIWYILLWWWSPEKLYPTFQSFPTPSPWKLKRELSLGMSFPKREGASQHICEAYEQLLLEPKDIPGSSSAN